MKSAARFIDANTTCSLSKPSFNLTAKEKKPAYAADSFPVSSSPGAWNDSRTVGASDTDQPMVYHELDSICGNTSDPVM